MDDDRPADLVMQPLLAQVEGGPQVADIERHVAQEIPEPPQERFPVVEGGAVLVYHLDPERHLPEGLPEGTVEIDIVEGGEEHEEDDPHDVLRGEPVEPETLAESARGPQSRVCPHPVHEVEEVERGEDEDEVDGAREQANPESRVRMFFPHRERARSGISEMIHHHAHRGDGGRLHPQDPLSQSRPDKARPLPFPRPCRTGPPSARTSSPLRRTRCVPPTRRPGRALRDRREGREFPVPGRNRTAWRRRAPPVPSAYVSFSRPARRSGGSSGTTGTAPPGSIRVR